MRIVRAAMVAVWVMTCGLLPGAAASESLDASSLTHAYETIIHPDFSRDAVWVGISDGVSLPTTEYPWRTINWLGECGVEIVRGRERGFRLVGDCRLEGLEPAGGCGQVGLNTAFVFNAEEGFEVAVSYSYRELPGAFRVELHTQGFYAHGTLAVGSSSAEFYTCCDGCFRDGPCRWVGREWADLDWWQSGPHMLTLVYDPIYRLVEGWIDGNHRVGGWIMPIEFGTTILRLFVDCWAGAVGPVDVEVHDVLIGLNRSDRTP